MYELTPEEFAHNLRAVPDQRRALMIGYDGTHKLLGYDDSEVLKDKLKLGRNLGTLAAQRRWRELCSHQEDGSPLEPYTRVGPVDEQGIWMLAELVRSRHLSTLVATDPHRRLLRALTRRGVEMQYVQLDAWRPERLEHVPLTPPAAPVFIEGGDVIFRFDTSWAIPPPEKLADRKDVVAEVRGHLKSLLDQFDVVMCWGWSDVNLHTQFMYEPASGRQLYLLGEYTERVATISPRGGHLVSAPDGGDDVSPAILIAVGRTLGCKESPYPTQPPDVDPVPRPPSSASLLLQLAVLERTVKVVLDKRISVVGVEGGLVRARLADAISLEAQRRIGSSCRLIGGNLAMLRQEVRLRRRRAAVVADLSASLDPESLLEEMGGWLDDCERAKLSVVLLTLPEVSDGLDRSPLSQWIRDSRNVHVQTLQAGPNMTPTGTVEWIAGQVHCLRPEPGQGARLDALAQRMIADVRGRDGEAWDRFHQVVDVWAIELAALAGDRDDMLVSIDDAGVLWAELVESLQQKEAPPPPAEDFTLGPARLRPPAPPDFEVHVRAQRDRAPSGRGGLFGRRGRSR